MSEELPTAEQAAEMRAKLEAFDAARREELAQEVDAGLATLFDVTENTLTADLATTLELEARGAMVTDELSQLLTAIARCIHALPASINRARERGIAAVMAGEASTDEPAAEEPAAE